jgi:hypothetical protein
MTPIMILGLIIVVAVALYLLQRSIRVGRRVALRPLPALIGLRVQLGRAIESGNPLHITLGNASLVSPASPTSLAALHVLDHLAAEGCANGTPPLVTVGEGTLLPAAQDSLRHAYQKSGRSGEFDPAQAQFIAAETNPFIYAGGAGALLQQDRVTGSVAVGRFGPELALIAEAANRQEGGQLLGTDDPTALAIAVAFSQDVLVGEEMLAAGAYLDGDSGRLAALQLQDIIRWIVAGGLVLLALIEGLL